MQHPFQKSSKSGREYVRAQVPVFFRPARRRLRRRRLSNVHKLRIYSDEPLPVRSRLEIDLVFSRECIVTCVAEVRWNCALTDNEHAEYDIGLDVIDAPISEEHRLHEVFQEAA